MVTEFVMPKLGDIMEEGKVVSWHKRAGESLVEGEVLLEIEMDKGVVDVEADCAGVVLRILVEEGQTVPVGTALALIGEAGETI